MLPRCALASGDRVCKHHAQQQRIDKRRSATRPQRREVVATAGWCEGNEQSTVSMHVGDVCGDQDRAST